MNGTDLRLRKYSYNKCREKAEQFLDKVGYLTLPNLPVVNIEIVSQLAGINVNIIEDLQCLGLYGMGFKNLKENKYEILIDSLHYANQNSSAQFTIAEELGHLLIHSSLFEYINSIEERIDYEKSLTEETHQLFEMEAKKVASELLLPKKIFNSFIKNWSKENFDKLQKSNPNDEEELCRDISEKLSPKFNLNTIVIQRALKRWNPTRLIDEIVSEQNFGLLKNSPCTRITISEDAKQRAKKRLS